MDRRTADEAASDVRYAHDSRAKADIKGLPRWAKQTLLGVPADEDRNTYIGIYRHHPSATQSRDASGAMPTELRPQSLTVHLGEP